MNEVLAYSLLFNLILMYLVASLYTRILYLQNKLDEIHRLTAPKKKVMVKPVETRKKMKYKIYE